MASYDMFLDMVSPYRTTFKAKHNGIESPGSPEALCRQPQARAVLRRKELWGSQAGAQEKKKLMEDGGEDQRGEGAAGPLQMQAIPALPRQGS